MTKGKQLHPDIVPLFERISAEFAVGMQEVLLEIITEHPGKLNLPNDAFVLLEMSICNIMLRFGVKEGNEAKIMKVLTKNVTHDMARHRLRTIQPQGNA